MGGKLIQIYVYNFYNGCSFVSSFFYAFFQNEFSYFYLRGVLCYRTCKDRELVLKGIPVQLRAELWMLYSGAINEVSLH